MYTFNSFNGDPAVKEGLLNAAPSRDLYKEFLWEFDAEGEGDELSSPHGIPYVVIHLCDGILYATEFEAESRAQRDKQYKARTEFARTIIRAIPVGVSLHRVWPQFAHWFLTDPVYGMAHQKMRQSPIAANQLFSKKPLKVPTGEDARKALAEVIKVFKSYNPARPISEEAWWRLDTLLADASTYSEEDIWDIPYELAAAGYMVSSSKTLDGVYRDFKDECYDFDRDEIYQAYLDVMCVFEAGESAIMDGREDEAFGDAWIAACQAKLLEILAAAA